MIPQVVDHHLVGTLVLFGGLSQLCDLSGVRLDFLLQFLKLGDICLLTSKSIQTPMQEHINKTFKDIPALFEQVPKKLKDICFNIV